MTSKAKALGKPAVMLGRHLSSPVHVAKKLRPRANSQRQLANPKGYAGNGPCRHSGCDLTRVPSLAEPSSSTVHIPDPQKRCEKRLLLCQAAEFGVVLCIALDNEHRWSGSKHDPHDPGRLHFAGAGGPSPTWLQGVSLGTGVGTFSATGVQGSTSDLGGQPASNSAW